VPHDIIPVSPQAYFPQNHPVAAAFIGCREYAKQPVNDDVVDHRLHCGRSHIGNYLVEKEKGRQYGAGWTQSKPEPSAARENHEKEVTIFSSHPR
jgi:hypothetical protein